MPSVEVLAVVDPDPAQRVRAQEVQPSVSVHADLDHALIEHELDFACLAVPVPLLPRCAEVTLAAGLHTFVEKPFAPTEAAAEAVLELAAQRGCQLTVGHVERFNPAVIALKERLEAGAIGKIVEMHARRLSPYPNRRSPAGVAVDLATHDIDVMRYLAVTEVERVYAEAVAHLNDDIEDLICATLRFVSGATGLLEANWITPTKVRQLSVLGEGGMFIVDYLTQDLAFYEHPTASTHWGQLAGIRGGGEGNMIRYALERREPLRVQWEAFVAAIRDGTPPPVHGRDGIAALSVGRAIQRSATAHEVVTPTYREPVAV